MGIAGSGMNPLARFRLGGGGTTSGSDRLFDQGREPALRETLRELGATLHPQDGSGVEGASLLVTSTAVEAAIPDLVRAQELGIPIVHRAGLLAHHLGSGPSIGVGGSSGKSTTTALLFSLLRRLGRDPGLVCGAAVLDASENGPSPAASGKGPLVAEVDESDGSLVQHRPEVGIVLNLHRDHMEPAAILEQFRVFASHLRGKLVVSDDEELRELRPAALVFGFGPEASFRGEELQLDARGSRFSVRGQPLELSLPGAHNATNALAALAALEALGIPVEESGPLLSRCRGVARRFQELGTRNDIAFVDDYAHNPAKVAAALAAAKLRGARLRVFFQPHGFGPTRFHRDGFVAAFAEGLGPEDSVHLGSIYYAGGTVSQTISSEELAEALRARGCRATAGDREGFRATLKETTRAGDLVLILGARDPELGAFARSLLDAVD